MLVFLQESDNLLVHDLSCLHLMPTFGRQGLTSLVLIFGGKQLTAEGIPTSPGEHKNQELAQSGTCRQWKARFDSSGAWRDSGPDTGRSGRGVQNGS
jgi:hypothetical protein